MVFISLTRRYNTRETSVFNTVSDGEFVEKLENKSFVAGMVRTYLHVVVSYINTVYIVNTVHRYIQCVLKFIRNDRIVKPEKTFLFEFSNTLSVNKTNILGKKYQPPSRDLFYELRVINFRFSNGKPIFIFNR